MSACMQFMCVCIYVCMYVCMSVCMLVCMHVCMYACTHGCMYAYMYVCMYVCMHACMCVFMRRSAAGCKPVEASNFGARPTKENKEPLALPSPRSLAHSTVLHLPF